MWLQPPFFSMGRLQLGQVLVCMTFHIAVPTVVRSEVRLGLQGWPSCVKPVEFGWLVKKRKSLISLLERVKKEDKERGAGEQKRKIRKEKERGAGESKKERKEKKRKGEK